VIQLVEITPEGVGRNASELVRKIKAAKYWRETLARSARPSGKKAPKRWLRRSTSSARSDGLGRADPPVRPPFHRDFRPEIGVPCLIRQS
jgi:hypothetical protein